MTDQPPQAEQEQAPAQAPEQGGPPPAPQHGEAMRFMIRLQDHPDLPDYNQAAGLYRFQVTEERVITDRFDRQRGMWVDWPSMIAFTGIGGADDFIEVNEDEANNLIQRWLGEEGEGQPEGEPEPETPLGERGFELSGSLRRLYARRDEGAE